jgi:hypothetical protein
MTDPALELAIATYGPAVADAFIKAAVGAAVGKGAEGIGRFLSSFRGWGERRSRSKQLEEALSSGDRAELLALVSEWLGEDSNALAAVEADPSIQVLVRSDHAAVSGTLDQRAMGSGGDSYSVTDVSGPVAQGPGATAIQHVHRSDAAP